MISEDCIMYLSTQVIHFSLGNPFQSSFSLLGKEFACHGEVIVQCKCTKKKKKPAQMRICIRETWNFKLLFHLIRTILMGHLQVPKILSQ